MAWSVVGYPTTDETGTPDGVGRFNHFAGDGGSSIYWTPRTGAWSIHGGIRARWASMGGRGRLGCPITDEYGILSERRNDFVHGRISYFFAGVRSRSANAAGAEVGQEPVGPFHRQLPVDLRVKDRPGRAKTAGFGTVGVAFRNHSPGHNG